VVSGRVGAPADRQPELLLSYAGIWMTIAALLELPNAVAGELDVFDKCGAAQGKWVRNWIPEPLTDQPVREEMAVRSHRAIRTVTICP
jgi:hypothetical protein